ncbi:MAG TPA: DUF547 domain-containing protein [Candidatus Omnitrophota bacterium]|nr:DUF547 domain-containing protein [Candidatus Omnitrophota bacterium]
MNFKKIVFLWGIVFLLPASTLQAANRFDHSLWDAFLKKYVNEKGEVNYQAVVRDPKLLNDYWNSLLSSNLQLIQTQFSREESLAFWLNVYHAALIKLVTEHYPISSTQKIPSFWDITLVHFGKEGDKTRQYSLNDIRIKNLMAIYRDERVHLALSMAAQDGPPMMREAFTGPKVQGQIFILTRQFVNNPRFVDIVPNRKKIFISPIFKWHGKDFKLDFGVPEPIGNFSMVDTAVLSFLAYYLEDESKIEYLQGAHYKIEYPAFDWTLNDWKVDVS